MKLAGVTVAYNPTDSVIKNIETYIDFVGTLYVVDNSDGDNSKLFSHEKIKYIPNGKNLGIAAALNIAADKAIQDGFDWLLTMDQDSRFPDADTISRMTGFVDLIETDSTVPYLFGFNKEKMGVITPFHMMSTFKGELPSGFEFVDLAMTSGNIVSLLAYKQVGGYNEDLFIDAVDYDFCLNLRSHDYQIVRLNYVMLDHNLGDPVFKTILGRKMYSFNHNYIRCYYISRNRQYFCHKYKKQFRSFCRAEKKRSFREAVKIILLEDDKYRKIRSIYRGYRDYKRGVTGAIPEKFK